MMPATCKSLEEQAPPRRCVVGFESPLSDGPSSGLLSCSTAACSAPSPLTTTLREAKQGGASETLCSLRRWSCGNGGGASATVDSLSSGAGSSSSDEDCAFQSYRAASMPVFIPVQRSGNGKQR